MAKATVMGALLVAACGGGQTQTQTQTQSPSDCRAGLEQAALVMATAMEEHAAIHPAETSLAWGIRIDEGVAGERLQPPQLASASAPAALELRGPYVAVMPSAALIYASAEGSRRERPSAIWPLAHERSPFDDSDGETAAVRDMAEDFAAVLASVPAPELIIAVDAAAPWRLVARVGRAAASAGYVRLRFLVDKKDAVRIGEDVPAPISALLAEGGGIEQIGPEIAAVVAKSCADAAIEFDLASDESPMKAIVRGLPRCSCDVDLATLEAGVVLSFERVKALGEVRVRLTSSEVAAALGGELAIALDTPWSVALVRLHAGAAAGPVSFGRLVSEQFVPPPPPPPPAKKKRRKR